MACSSPFVWLDTFRPKYSYTKFVFFNHHVICSIEQRIFQPFLRKKTGMVGANGVRQPAGSCLPVQVFFS